jgi:hypothetical protein
MEFNMDLDITEDDNVRLLLELLQKSNNVNEQ